MQSSIPRRGPSNSRTELQIGHCRYLLHEYHFHLPGEHEIDGTIYPSELHYVYREIGPDGLKPCQKLDVCGGHCPEDAGNILAVGFGIENGERRRLEKLPAIFPPSYYEYDGSLTTPNFDPVRWIVGRCPVPLSLKQIRPIAKEARPLQPVHGRIILVGRKENSS